VGERMIAVVRCPVCGYNDKVMVNRVNVADEPVLSIDDQAISDSTPFECTKCKKELRIQLSIELFE
jgi:DNA-directed RNA polymerase subunit RPC12/RpoP